MGSIVDQRGHTCFSTYIKLNSSTNSEPLRDTQSPEYLHNTTRTRWDFIRKDQEHFVYFLKDCPQGVPRGKYEVIGLG